MKLKQLLTPGTVIDVLYYLTDEDGLDFKDVEIIGLENMGELPMLIIKEKTQFIIIHFSRCAEIRIKKLAKNINTSTGDIAVH